MKMDQEERVRDLRVPLISGMFFVTCLTGGILLVLWLLEVQGSQPWFPILALILIGLPWIFWFLTYIYTFLKSCFRRGRGGGGGGGGGTTSSRGHSASKPSNQAAAPATADNGEQTTSPRKSGDSSKSKRQAQLRAAVAVEGGSSSGGDGGQSERGDGGGESSVASSRECEMPLTLSVSS